MNYRTFSLSRFIQVFLAGVVFLSLPGPALHGQGATGSIEGYVRDKTEAVLPGATVEITSRDTGAKRSLITDDRGYYLASNLAPGNYQLRFSLQGFTPTVLSDVVLHVGDQLSLDGTLQVAGVQSEVVVTGVTPLVEPTRSGSSEVIAEQEIKALPLNNRNWTELALLTPGVAVDAEFDAPASVSVNGVEGVFNNIQVDGVDNNNAFFGELRGRTRAPFQFSQETVKEFRVLTTAYSAEFGRAAGGVINAITKSGTNEFHGSGWYYIRDDALNAAPFFTNAANLPKPDTRRQQFGFTFGGPIQKDSLFFFVNYDQQVRNDPVSIVFGDRFRNELDFNPLNAYGMSSFVTGSNSFFDAVDGTGSKTLNLSGTIDPRDAAIVNQAFLNWAFARAYFLGDTSFLGRTFQTPVGAIESVNPFPARTFANVQRTVPRNPDQKVFFPKITWLINQNHTFNFQWNLQDFNSGPNGVFTNPTKTDNLTADGTESNRSDSLVFSLSSVLSPTLLNELRFQFVRDNAVTSTNGPGLPGININGFDMGSQTFLPRFTKEKRYQWQDNFSIIRGRNELRLGFDIVLTKDDNFFPGSFNGRYSFRGPGTFIEMARAVVADAEGSTAGRNYFGTDVSTGEGPRGITAARFLIQNFQQRFGQAETNQTTVDYGVYAQSSWRLRPDFTLNLGVRYEFQDLSDPVLPNPLVPQTANINEDKNNFAPRVGVAWSPHRNLVVRAGYGIFYLRTAELDVDNALKNNNAFSFNQFLSGSAAASAGLVFNPAALDPLDPSSSGVSKLAAPTNACPNPPACADPFASVNFFAPNRANGYTHQASLEIQWQFMRNTSISVGYHFTKGSSLPRNRNINVLSRDFALANARTFTFLDANGNPDRTIDIPDYRANSFSNRPDPNFSALNINESEADSWYNAFILNFERRMYKGLSFGIAYTLSKNVTDVANGFNSSGTFFSDLFDQNDPAEDRGLSRLDHRHNWAARAVWELPWGKDLTGVSKALASGWSLGVVHRARTGLAMTPVVDEDINRDNARTAFGAGDRVPFLARGSFTGQGRNNFDLSAYKSFSWGDNYTVQFRLQAFNAFNHTAFTRFDDVLYNVSGNTATLNPDFLGPAGRALRSRDIQLGLVFRF